jgi:parallel beta helix pectate lyase-like protein
MRIETRLTVVIGTLLVLAAVIAFGNRLRAARGQPTAAVSALELKVDSAADRGPGSLREALYAADAADRAATITIQAPNITLETPLPPLINPRGIRIVGPARGVEIDARAVASGPVLDVATEHNSIAGVHVRNCAASAVLVRASRFQLTGAEITACDVGVDVADTVSAVAVEHSQFIRNRIGVRLAGSSASTVIAANRFTEQKDAGLWAVRAALEPNRRDAIAVHDNSFNRDRISIVAGNIALTIQDNSFADAREAAVHLIGTGVQVRGNHITSGPAMGVIAEGTHGVVIEGNELANLAAFGILVKASGNARIQSNRIHHCGYGIGFVLGDQREPSTAIDNTIIAETYDGIDVLGDSPTLRRNKIVDARGKPIKVEDYRAPDGTATVSHPFMADNSITAASAELVAATPPSPPRATPK